MRIDIIGQGSYGAGGIGSNGGVVNGPLTLPGDPVNFRLPDTTLSDPTGIYTYIKY